MCSRHSLNMCSRLFDCTLPLSGPDGSSVLKQPQIARAFKILTRVVLVGGWPMAASAHAVPLGKLHCFAKTGACPGCRVFVPDSASGNLLARWEFRDVWCRCHSSPKLASKNLSRHVNELEAIWSSTCDEYLPGQGGDFPRLLCGVNNKGRPARGTLGGTTTT